MVNQVCRPTAGYNKPYQPVFFDIEAINAYLAIVATNGAGTIADTLSAPFDAPEQSASRPVVFQQFPCPVDGQG